MPLIKVSKETEAKVFRALLETRQPIQSIAPANEHLYLINRYQLEVLKQLGLPFEEIQLHVVKRVVPKIETASRG